MYEKMINKDVTHVCMNLTLPEACQWTKEVTLFEVLQAPRYFPNVLKISMQESRKLKLK